MDAVFTKIADWYTRTLGSFMPEQVFCFLVSMIPLIELRGGVFIAATIFRMPIWEANLICIAGNLLPIPFILLFIRRIFAWMKRHNILVRFVEALENRAMRKSKGMERGEFVFLLLFTGIPLPGTGAWTGSLIASLLETDIKKASLAIGLGVLMAAIIMDIISYGLFGLII